MSQMFGGATHLENHPPLHYGAGPWALVLGAPLLVGGVSLLVAASRTSPSGADGPVTLVVMATLGLLFGGLGALFLAACVGALLRLRRRAALLCNPDRPWRLDHSWDERLAYDRGNDPLLRLGIAVFLTLFVTLFNVGAFGPGKATDGFKAVAVGLDLILAGVWAWAIYVLARRLKYGGTKVRLATFPFLVGQTLKVTVELSPALRDFPVLRARLRLVSQEWRTTGKNTKLTTTECWAAEQVIPRDQIGREVPLAFEVPADAQPSSLSSTPAYFWELQLDAETPGIDFHGLFLLPVY